MNLIDKLIRAAAGILLLMALTFLGWRYLVQPAQLRSAIAQILGIRIPLLNIFPLPPHEVLELATVTQPVLVQYKATKGGWPIQSKLTLQGLFEVKIGFDLNLNTAVSVDHSTLHAVVRLPLPRILSVEPKNYEVLHSDQALWTSFTPEEQNQALMGMKTHAKESSNNGETVELAVKNLKGRIEQIAPLFGGTIEVVVEPAVEKRG